ncbi:TPA: LOW QUALITY PROTEIN: hypothetical protein N0F65_010286, partial [Lagenidium giganteum]
KYPITQQDLNAKLQMEVGMPQLIAFGGSAPAKNAVLVLRPMTISLNMRWRAIVLTFVYGIEAVETVLGISIRSIERWYKLFKHNGKVLPRQQTTKSSRWPAEPVVVHAFTWRSCEKLSRGEFLRSAMSLCSRCVVCYGLISTSLENIPMEIQTYYAKLSPFYNGPDQLVFIDETAKDGRDVMRRYA